MIEVYTTITSNGYAFPCRKSDYCFLSYDSKKYIAKKHYSEFGYIENADIYDDEVIAILKL